MRSCPPPSPECSRARGHTAEHVGDVGLSDAPDHVLWQYALANHALIITKDEDFPEMAAVRATAPAIVWVRLGNTTRRALLEWFEPLIDRVVDMAESGHKVIELR
jgi:predicted nuclease of predicted toxin-antitoxin system